MGLHISRWAPGRAIRSYYTGINREAGIRFYPWRSCLNYDFSQLIVFYRCSRGLRRFPD